MSFPSNLTTNSTQSQTGKTWLTCQLFATKAGQKYIWLAKFEHSLRPPCSAQSNTGKNGAREEKKLLHTARCQLRLTNFPNKKTFFCWRAFPPREWISILIIKKSHITWANWWAQIRSRESGRVEDRCVSRAASTSQLHGWKVPRRRSARDTHLRHHQRESRSFYLFSISF